MEKQVSEGSLHKWFKGSKSKDGKGGWVNVVTGGTCASDEPGEGTPKCVSSAKRASMTKAERLSAARRKKKADPGQQQKSGAAKPTYVSTDKPKKKKMKESYTRSLTPLTEKAKKCWPGYEKKGTKKMFGKTYNNCVKKEEVQMEDKKPFPTEKVDRKLSSLDKKMASKPYGYKRSDERNRSMKISGIKDAVKRGEDPRADTRGGAYAKQGNPPEDHRDHYSSNKRKRKVKPAGVRKEEVVYSEAKIDEKNPKNKRERRNVSKFGPQTKPYDPDTKEMKTSMSKHMQGMRQSMHKSKRGRKTRGPDAGMRTEAVNAAQQAAIAIAKKKKQEDDMVARKKKQKMYAGYEPQGELVDEDLTGLKIKAIEYGAKKNIPGTRMLAKAFDFDRKLRSGKPGDGYIGDKSLNIKNPISMIGKQIKKNPAGFTLQNMSHEPEGETIEEADKKGKGSGTKDACYHKVKSRYSVWPSAYASGALVKCRKVGAANWGNSSKKESFSDWKSEFIWEDGDSSKKIEEKIQPGVKGDGFLGPTVGGLGIPNPIRVTKDVVDTYNRSQQKNVNAINKELPGSAKMGKFKEFNKTVSPATTKLLGIKNSYEYEKSDWRSDLDEDWQKTNRQDKTDGMSQKAVNAYKRENPGSKLKTAVTQKPSTLKRGSKKAKRRKSFCSRMKGMKKRLTSAKTARDPDSRINKALRRWNC